MILIYSASKHGTHNSYMHIHKNVDTKRAETWALVLFCPLNE